MTRDIWQFEPVLCSKSYNEGKLSIDESKIDAKKKTPIASRLSPQHNYRSGLGQWAINRCSSDSKSGMKMLSQPQASFLNTHTHTHTNTLSNWDTRIHTHTHALTQKHSHTYCVCVCVCVSLSLSLSLQLKYTHTHSTTRLTHTISVSANNIGQFHIDEIRRNTIHPFILILPLFYVQSVCKEISLYGECRTKYTLQKFF